MDKLKAREILSVLAEGIDPYTGEVLPDDHICNKGDVLRALQIAVSVLSKDNKSKNPPENAGKPWDVETDAELSKMYDENTQIKDLCGYFKRTRGSIASRLVRLGKISSSDELAHGKR